MKLHMLSRTGMQCVQLQQQLSGGSNVLQAMRHPPLHACLGAAPSFIAAGAHAWPQRAGSCFVLHMLTDTGSCYVQLHQLCYKTFLHAVGRHSTTSATMPRLSLHLSMLCTIP